MAWKGFPHSLQRRHYYLSVYSGAGPRFTNGFSIAIQIRWKFHFTLTSTLIPWSLQNFVHDTTAVLSCHVRKFVSIWWPATELRQPEVSIEFELRAKIVSETGPWSKKTSKLRVTGLSEGNSPVTGEFPTKGPVARKMFPFDDVIILLLWGNTMASRGLVIRRFDVFFVVSPNKLLYKQSSRQWSETP